MGGHLTIMPSEGTSRLRSRVGAGAGAAEWDGWSPPRDSNATRAGGVDDDNEVRMLNAPQHLG